MPARPTWLLVEEQHIGLDARLIKDAGRQSKQGMHIELSEQSPSDYLSCPTLKQHVVGHDNCCSAGNPKQGRDVLDEVELLVLRGNPEILARVFDVITAGSAVLCDDCDRRLAPKRWIREDHAGKVMWLLGQGIPDL